jgi:hypothetical protein
MNCNIVLTWYDVDNSELTTVALMMKSYYTNDEVVVAFLKADDLYDSTLFSDMLIKKLCNTESTLQRVHCM